MRSTPPPPRSSRAVESSETLYFRAHVDDAGHDLDARCRYEIHGRPMPSRWWSITAYGNDDYLIANEKGRYSFNMANIAYEPDGGFVIVASPREEPGNWLPLGSSGHVSLTIRLYNPSPEAAARPAEISLPTIRARCP